MNEGDEPEARDACTASLEISRSLLERDPTNTILQRDVSIRHRKLGMILRRKGDMSGASASFRKGLQIIEGLSMRDPSNAHWQVGLAALLGELGSIGDGSGAEARLEFLRRGRSILAVLKEQNRLAFDQDEIAW